MAKNIIAEDTVIEIGKSVPLYKYRGYFEQATGKVIPSEAFMPWLNTQTGKTVKDALDAYIGGAQPKSMGEILKEERFSIISEADKAFITAFDEGISALGYDFGGFIGDGYVWGKYMIIYSKTGVKSKKIAARIYIRENSIALRLFLNDIQKHDSYIENTPEHIKNAFTGGFGDCSCNPKKENCRSRKTYTIDGRQHEKCSGVAYEFWEPTVEKLEDYTDLLREFYPLKKA